MKKLYGNILIFVLSLALVLDVVALATPGWLVTTIDANGITTWTCNGIFLIYVGEIYYGKALTVDETFTAVLLVVSAISLCCAITLTIRTMIGKENHSILTIELCLAAAIFILSGIAIYCVLKSNRGYLKHSSLGYSFVLSCISGGLCLVSSLVAAKIAILKDDVDDYDDAFLIL
uniref:uncharacterized protein LOC120329249 n=1 Tax=Styela clava TaxID=7725 RepID=UPI00193A72A1|nr:uncharacterized protein LOC120329249 [Styela clava]